MKNPTTCPGNLSPSGGAVVSKTPALAPLRSSAALWRRRTGVGVALLVALTTFQSRLSQAQDVKSILEGGLGNAPSLSNLSEDQVGSGLKEALSKGIEIAVKNLGKTGGFLDDLAVKIPMPPTLQKIEKMARAAGEGETVDKFIVSMNRAAEQAVPEAIGVLANSMQQMTLNDAKAILTSTNTAATAYFKRTSEKELHERFLPIVKKATDQVGVTHLYKQMTGKVDLGGFGSFGGFGGSNKENFDVDSYVTRKALDGLFIKIADQERQIRNNPVARTTGLLQQVFGAVGK
jgi:hypothetical protein